jgi:hypothetical protein
MIEISEPNLREVTSSYVVSNTPYFFFETLRETSTVKSISREFTADQLIDSIDELLVEEPTAAKSILTLFALIGALSLKANVTDYLRELDLSRYRWGKEFIRSCIQFSNTDIFLTINSAPHLTMIAPQQSSTTTNTAQINIP